MKEKTKDVLLFWLAVLEFWAALVAALGVQHYFGGPLWLLTPVIWGVIHWSPLLIGKKPLW